MKLTKKKITQSTPRQRCIFLLMLTTIVFSIFLIIRLLPATSNNIRRSLCFVDGYSQICLVTGKDTLVLRSDSIHQQGVWINKHWWWPSCGGRVLTLKQKDVPMLPKDWHNSKQIQQYLTQITDSIGILLDKKELECKELAYYLKSHGVQDEGYIKIAKYSDDQNKKRDSLKTILQQLKLHSIVPQSAMIRKLLCKVSWYDNDNRLQQTSCRPFLMSSTSTGNPIIIHTNEYSNPWGTYAVRNTPWGIPDNKHIVVAMLVPQDSTASFHSLIINGKTLQDNSHNLPKLFAPEGAPLFTKNGRFIGLVSGHQIIK